MGSLWHGHYWWWVALAVCKPVGKELQDFFEWICHLLAGKSITLNQLKRGQSLVYPFASFADVLDCSLLTYRM